MAWCVRHQVIIWANVDPYLWHHMASLVHNELISFTLLWKKSIAVEPKKIRLYAFFSIVPELNAVESLIRPLGTNTWVKFQSNFDFLSRKGIWKCLLQGVSDFIEASVWWSFYQNIWRFFLLLICKHIHSSPHVLILLDRLHSLVIDYDQHGANCKLYRF